jgi:hypothetical protein
MNETWYAAFGLLTLLSLVNAFVLVATLRQIGVLHQRIRPIGPGVREEGPQPGTQLPRLPFEAVAPQASGSPYGGTLSVFGYVSPGCGLCRDVPGFFRTYMKTRPPGVELSAVLITDADEEAAAAFAADHIGASEEPSLYRNPDLQGEYAFPGSPYVLALDSSEEGHLTVLAAGVVNELEQLEDLIDGAIAYREGSRRMAEEPVETPSPGAGAIPLPESGARTETSPVSQGPSL